MQRNASKLGKLLRLTTAELKIVALMSFFLTFGVVTAVYLCLYARNYEYVLSLAVKYVYCQLDGMNPSCEKYRYEIERNRYHGMANASYLFMGIMAISNLLFAIHMKQLKTQVRRLSVKAASKLRTTLNQSRNGATQSKQSRDS